MDTIKKVFLYCRVSTLQQKEAGFGIETQLRICRDHCRQGELDPIREFVDRGISGTTMDRPALDEMLRELDQVDAVVVVNTSRLWRAILPQALIQQALKDAGKDIIAVDQPTYSINSEEDAENAEDMLVHGIMEVLDRYHRLELKRKLMRGRREKASRGYVPCGHAAFGYRWSEQRADGKRIRAIEPDPEEGPLVGEIFRGYLRIQSITKLREYLILKGHTNRSGHFFSVEALRVVLGNPVYKGVVKYGPIEEVGKHEPLISDVIFGRVKAALKRNLRRRQPKRPVLYVGGLPRVTSRSLAYWGSSKSRTKS